MDFHWNCTTNVSSPAAIKSCGRNRRGILRFFGQSAEYSPDDLFVRQLRGGHWLYELRKDGKNHPVEPKAFDLLHCLIENRDQLVTKDELIEFVWKGRIISDATLGSCINAARKAIGDNGKEQKFIQTLPRRGFRFVGTVIQNTSAPTYMNLGVSKPPLWPVRTALLGVPIPSIISGRVVHLLRFSPSTICLRTQGRIISSTA